MMPDEAAVGTKTTRLGKAQLICELCAFLICLVVTGAQLGFLDYYFVLYGKDNLWLLWIIADCLVLGVMCWLLHFAITYNRRCLTQTCKDEANLKYAFIVWLVYSLVLSAKIATFFTKFDQDLLPEKVEPSETAHLHALWGPIVLKFILSASAGIFLLLVMSHHYNKLRNERASYLSYISSTITIDLLDSVLFLELLVEPTIAERLSNMAALRAIILAFACINFVLPTFSLFKLRYKRLPSWAPLPYETLYSLFYFLFVNVPYLIIRSYLWRQEKHDVSIFIVKNVVMIVLGMRDVWVAYLVKREERTREKLRAVERRTRDDGSATSADKMQ